MASRDCSAHSESAVSTFAPISNQRIIHRPPETPDRLKPVRGFRADFLSPQTHHVRTGIQRSISKK